MSADLARELAHCEAQILYCEGELRNSAEIEGPALGLHDWAQERRLILAALNPTA